MVDAPARPAEAEAPVMKAMGGKGNPALVNDVLKKLLG